MEANQCDGCKRGLAVKYKIHFEKDGKPYIGCSSSLYEKSHRPSDLEIVQQALDQSKLVDHRCASLDFDGDGDWIVWQYSESAAHQFASGNGRESLLTWAKQTIGVE